MNNRINQLDSEVGVEFTIQICELARRQIGLSSRPAGKADNPEEWLMKSVRLAPPPPPPVRMHKESHKFKCLITNNLSE